MTQYSKGANFERRLIKYLREQGFRAHRTAGSHTPIDVIAGIDGKVYAFQCQIDKYFPPAKIEALKDEAREFGAFPCLAWREGKEIKMEYPR
jgi:Holliday junction resolvase